LVASECFVLKLLKELVKSDVDVWNLISYEIFTTSLKATLLNICWSLVGFLNCYSFVKLQAFLFVEWWKQNWISCVESVSFQAGSRSYGWHWQHIHKTWQQSAVPWCSIRNNCQSCVGHSWSGRRFLVDSGTAVLKW